MAIFYGWKISEDFFKTNITPLDQNFDLGPKFGPRNAIIGLNQPFSKIYWTKKINLGPKFGPKNTIFGEI